MSRSGGRILVDQLALHGADLAFGVPGESYIDVLDALRRRGHHVVPQAPWSLGRMCAVSRDPATGVLRAGANPRGMQGYAVGR